MADFKLWEKCISIHSHFLFWPIWKWIPPAQSQSYPHVPFGDSKFHIDTQSSNCLCRQLSQSDEMNGAPLPGPSVSGSLLQLCSFSYIYSLPPLQSTALVTHNHIKSIQYPIVFPFFYLTPFKIFFFLRFLPWALKSKAHENDFQVRYLWGHGMVFVRTVTHAVLGGKIY